MANGLVNSGLYSTNGAFKAATTLVRGQFVTPNYVGKTCAAPGADALRDVYMVDNHIDTPEELAVADRDSAPLVPSIFAITQAIP